MQGLKSESCDINLLNTCLYRACLSGNSFKVCKYLSLGAEVNHRSSCGSTLLIVAIQSDNICLVKRLLACHNIDIHLCEISETKRTPLFCSVCSHSIVYLQLLLQYLHH